jgi:hypothetical protein
MYRPETCLNQQGINLSANQGVAAGFLLQRYKALNCGMSDGAVWIKVG